MTGTGNRLRAEDRALIQAAERALRERFVTNRHSVAAAVRTRSGRVYVGLNLDGIHSPCAEPVALGAAITAGDRDFESMVAVCRRPGGYRVLSACGNCRQLLFDYAPRASIILRFRDGRLARLEARQSLPAAYSTFAED